MNEGLSKEERLKSRKLIEALFSDGESFTVFPFRFIYMLPGSETIGQTKIAFSVSKRNFPHAVDRNLIKRQMREIYRMNKSYLASDQFPPAAVMIIYSAKQMMPFVQMKTRFCKGLDQLRETIQEKVQG